MCILFRRLFIIYTKKVHYDTKVSFYTRLVILYTLYIIIYIIHYYNKNTKLLQKIDI